MKKLMLAAVASTLLGGCAHDPSAASRESRAGNDDYVVGSNLPRKKGQSSSKTSTASQADVEEAKMR